VWPALDVRFVKGNERGRAGLMISVWLLFESVGGWEGIAEACLNAFSNAYALKLNHI
jgi:hypothetical protein